jgi:hypothetical protein
MDRVLIEATEARIVERREAGAPFMTHVTRLNKSSVQAQPGRPQSGERAASDRESHWDEHDDRDDRLWCVHLEGLDDFVATSSREAAEREASAINAYLERAGRSASTQVVGARAMMWPYTEAGHARSLETDWHDLQCMPHAQANALAHEGPFWAVMRRLKSWVSRPRHKR